MSAQEAAAAHNDDQNQSRKGERPEGTPGQTLDRHAQHTGQELTQVEADADRDRWFTAPEAKDYGFIDHVITSALQAADEGRPARAAKD